jgi:hypothetical protein
LSVVRFERLLSVVGLSSTLWFLLGELAIVLAVLPLEQVLQKSFVELPLKW